MPSLSASARLLHLFRGWLCGLPNQCRFGVGDTPCFIVLLVLFTNVFINISAFCFFYLYFYSVSLPNAYPGVFVHTVHVT